jgi:hypothetical protein
MGITISIPDQGVGNPVVTVDSNYIGSLIWEAPSGVNSNPKILGGRAYYTFIGTNNNSGTVTNWTTGNNKAITLLFSNNNGLAGLQLNDESPTYGPTGLMYFSINLETADVTDYNQKFYGNNPLPVNNLNTPSFVGAQSLSILPAFLQDFNVNKRGDTDADLIWTTAQEQNVSHFILERSHNGNNGWQKFAEVKAKGNSNTLTKYSYTDVKVFDGVAASKIVFYRIRAIDMDGQEKIFPVRSIRFSATGSKNISLYPNPAKEGFTLSIPLVNPVGSKIRLNLINRLGQVVHAREINGVSASNYYYDIKTPGVISGEYMLQILLDNELLDTKKVIVQR